MKEKRKKNKRRDEWKVQENIHSHGILKLTWFSSHKERYYDSWLSLEKLVGNTF
jgi:hypothetical protein